MSMTQSMLHGSLAHAHGSSTGFSGTGLEVGDRLWIPCDRQVWRAGIVVGTKSEIVNDRLKSSAVVEIRGDGVPELPEQLVLDVTAGATAGAKGAPAYLPRSESGLLTKENIKSVEDLSLLPLLAEPEVLHALSMRYSTQRIYTFAGPMLLAVNPYQDIPGLYHNDLLQKFADVPNGCPSPMPHIFGTARDAFLGIQHSKMSQTVLVSGESGAGKTESAKLVIRFLALAGGRKPDCKETMECRVLESVPLLEALGNACTLKNDNSSRFGKFIELQFKHMAGVFGPCIVDAETHTYLLETVRVTELNEGERCFHIFYQILAAAARARLQSSLHGSSTKVLQLSPCLPSLTFSDLGHWTPQNFAFLAQSSREGLSGVDEAAQFDRTVEAMRAFDMTDDEISEVVGAIVAVLHMGNIQFQSASENRDASEVVDKNALTLASELLGVNSEDLATALCTRTLQVHEKSTKQVIRTCRTATQAATCRDALARHLYGMVFKYVLSRINKELSGRASNAKLPIKSTLLPSIGVLDIFGFEVFEHNCFEQLCINFANEVLQQHFNMVVLEHELALYESEGIPCDVPEANAAVPQQHLRDSVVRSGLFPMLDEECSLAGGTSDSWLSKVTVRYGNSSVFQLNPLCKGHFIVHHFAGPVEYCADAFLAKNKDHLSFEGMECMQGSSKKVLRQQFANHGRKFGTSFSPTKSGRVLRAKVHTVSSSFRDQLDNLMKTIQATKTHFVRCLRPNQIAEPGSFDFHSVLQQLRYQGVLEAIRVARFGYAFRLSHQQAVETYGILAPSSLRGQLKALVIKENYLGAAQALFSQLKESMFKGSKTDGIQVGKSLTFFRSEAMEILGMHVKAYRISAAIQVQSTWRGIRCSRHLNAVRRAAAVLQRVGRGYAARRAFQKCVRAVQCVQAWSRGAMQRSAFKRTVQAVLCLQRNSRKSLAMKKRRLMLEAESPKKTDQSRMKEVDGPAPQRSTAPCAVQEVSPRKPVDSSIVGKHADGADPQAKRSTASLGEMKSVQTSFDLVNEVEGLNDAVRVLQNMIKANETNKDAAVSAANEQKQAHHALQTEVQQTLGTMKDEVTILGTNISAIRGKVEHLAHLEQQVLEVCQILHTVHTDNAAKSTILSNLTQQQQQTALQIQAMDAASSAQQAVVQTEHQALQTNLQLQLAELQQETKGELASLNSKFLALVEKHQVQAPLIAKLEQLSALERSIYELRGDMQQVQTRTNQKAPLFEQLERMPALERSVNELRSNMQQVEAQSALKATMVEATMADKFEQVSALERSVVELRSDMQQVQKLEHVPALERSISELHADVRQVETRSLEKEPVLEALERVPALERSINELRVHLQQVRAQSVLHAPRIDNFEKVEVPRLERSINELRGDLQQAQAQSAQKAPPIENSEKVQVIERLVTEIQGKMLQVESQSVQEQDMLRCLSQEQQRTGAKLRSIDTDVSAARDHAEVQLKKEAANLKEEYHALQARLQTRLDVMEKETSALNAGLAVLSDRKNEAPVPEAILEKVERLSELRQSILELRGEVQQVREDAAKKQEVLSNLSQEWEKALPDVRSLDASVSAVKEQTDKQNARLSEEHQALQADLQLQLAAMKQEVQSLVRDSGTDTETVKSGILQFEEFVKSKFSAIQESIEKNEANAAEAGQKQQTHVDEAMQAQHQQHTASLAELRKEMTGNWEETLLSLRQYMNTAHSITHNLDSRFEELRNNVTTQQESMARFSSDIQPRLDALASKDDLADLQEHVKDLLDKHVIMKKQHQSMSVACDDLKTQLSNVLEAQQQQQTAAVGVLRAEMAGSLEEALSTMRTYLDTAHSLTRSLDTRNEADQGQTAALAALREEVAGSIETALSSLNRDLDSTQVLASQASQAPQSQQPPQTPPPKRLPLRTLPVPSKGVFSSSMGPREFGSPGPSPGLSSPSCLSTHPRVAVNKTAQSTGSAMAAAQGKRLSFNVTRVGSPKVIAPQPVLGHRALEGGSMKVASSAKTRTGTPPVASYGAVVRSSSLNRRPGRQASVPQSPTHSTPGLMRTAVKTDALHKTVTLKDALSVQAAKLKELSTVLPATPQQSQIPGTPLSLPRTPVSVYAPPGSPMAAVPSLPIGRQCLSSSSASAAPAAPPNTRRRSDTLSPSRTPLTPRVAHSPTCVWSPPGARERARSLGFREVPGTGLEHVRRPLAISTGSIRINSPGAAERSRSPGGDAAIQLTAAGAILVQRQQSSSEMQRHRSAAEVPRQLPADVHRQLLITEVWRQMSDSTARSSSMQNETTELSRTRSPSMRLETRELSRTRSPSASSSSPVIRLSSVPLQDSVRQRSSSPALPRHLATGSLEPPSVNQNSFTSITVPDPNATVEIRRTPTSTTFDFKRA